MVFINIAAAAEYLFGFKMMKWRSPVVYSIFAVIALLVAIAAFTVQIYRDRAFICENTGSRSGYRKWTLGPSTSHWYKKSPLEEFVETQEPDKIVHR